MAAPNRPEDTEARDRLQPALLDRLVRGSSDGARVLSKAELRAAVLRDLSWLFNAVQPNPSWQEDKPHLAGTVLNFGLPPLAGRQASKVDIHKLEAAIADTIRHFEPRILPHTLVVTAVEPSSVLDTHNIIEFQIRGHLWAQPVPLEILLRTKLDLEAGQVEVAEALGAAAPARNR